MKTSPGKRNRMRPRSTGSGAIPDAFGTSAAKASKADGRPREVRKKRFLVAKMESDRLKPQKVIIRNLSQFGLSCRAVFPPEVGEKMMFTLGQFGEVPGIVRWVRGGQFGVRLDVEIDTISIAMAKTGFRSIDYPLPAHPKFENMMIFEFFREGGTDDF